MVAAPQHQNPWHGIQNTFDTPRATQVTNPIAANIASGGPALPAAAFVDTVALLLPGVEEVAPSMLMVEGPPPVRTPLKVATEDVLAGEDVVVIAIRELMAVEIDIAGSMEVDDMDTPGIDIAVSIEVVGIDMPGMDICARPLLAKRKVGAMIVPNNMMGNCG